MLAARCAGLVLVPLLLAACGDAPAPDDGGLAQADDGLVVEVVPEPGAAPRRWTLDCDPPGGSHPDPEAACAALDAAPAPVPPDRRCAQVYGGPQTATVTGRHRGEPVELALSRTDACRTAQWDALAPLLGG